VAKDTLLKLDWNISEKHKANFRYTKSEESNPIFPGFSNTVLTMSSHWYSQDKILETVVGQLFSDWTDNFSTELKLSQRDYESNPKNNSNLPQVSLVFTGPDPVGTTNNRTLRFGTESSRHFNSLQTKTFDAYFAGNLVLNDHEIKAGFDLQENKIFNAFLQNTKGTYTFTGTDPVALWRNSTNTNNPTGGMSAYTVQLPLAGNTLTDGAANWTLNTVGLFLQDTWNVNRRLTLTGGVRVDMLSTDDRPKANAAASALFGYDNTATLDGAKLWQPRFGFNYALDTVDKRKSQVRGGVGLFMGSAASVWLTNPYQNTGVTTANFSCSGTGSSNCNSVRFNADPNAQPVIAGTPPAANVDFISPNARQPSVWKANLAWDGELPWYGLVASAEWLHTKVDQGLYYKHLNLGSAVRTNPVDGREMFYRNTDPNCFRGGNDTIISGCTVSKSNASTSFNNVTVVERTKKGSGDAITLALNSPTRNGFGWGVAYTRTSATEVSPLTSSTANSNWLNRSIYNPNEEVSANSASLIRNRFNATANWSRAFFGKYKTSFGVVYEGREGRPYSWVFANDANGDGVSGNDLLYIPKGPGSGEVLFRSPYVGSTAATTAQLAALQASSAAVAEAKFWSIVDSEPGLRNNKGRVVGRNTSFGKFTNSFDVRVSQEVPGLFNNNKGVLTLDILNFGNLVNKRWGRIDEAPFGAGSSRTFVRYVGIDPTTNKPIYSVNEPQDFINKNTRGESSWAMQITGRYEF
jgi:hypothetical protein